MSEIYEQAVAKLKKEKSECGGDKHVGAMKNAVCDALLEFCCQDDEFSKAVVQGGTFKDCMEAVAKNVGSSISDIEAYRRAVAFYFPGAGVHFEMRIDLCASVTGDEQQSGSQGKKDGLLINLDDLF